MEISSVHAVNMAACVAFALDGPNPLIVVCALESRLAK